MTKTETKRKSAREIREQITARQGEAESIISLAEAEERDLTSEEQRRFDRIAGRGREGESGYMQGEIGELKVKLQRAERHEEIQAEKLQRERLQNLYDSGVIAPGQEVGFPGYHSAGSRKAFNRDENGNQYAILNRGERLANFYSDPGVENAFGNFVVASLTGCNRNTPEPIRNAMSTGTPGGSFLVPDDFAASWVDKMRAMLVLERAGSTIIAMGSGSTYVPIVNTDPTTAVKAENAEITFSDIGIGSALLNCHTFVCGTKVSRELAEDSPQVAAGIIEQTLAQSHAAAIDRAFIQGISGGPSGIINNASISSTGSVGAIDWTDFNAAVAAIRGNNYEPTGIVLSPTIMSDLEGLETGDGTNSARGWLGASPTLQDKSWYPTSNIDDANAVVGDWSKHYIGLRTGTRIEMTTEAAGAFERHQIAFKCVTRADAVVVDASAFHLLEGITT